MNKKTFLLGSLLASAVSLFAQAQQHHLPQIFQTKHSVERSVSCLIDSGIQSYYANTWIVQGYSIILFDSQGNPRISAAQGGDTINFINTYDTNGYLTTVSQQSSDGSTWSTFQENTYTYDASGYQTSNTEKDDDGNGTLVTSYGYFYGAFDSHGKPTMETDIDYTVTPNDTTQYQYTYTYDSNGHILITVVQQWDGSAWQNAYQYTYTYDANGNPLTEIEQDWDGSAWQNQYKSEHHYSTNSNCGALGIKDINDNAVSVYPNPFTDKLMVANNAPFQLFNLLGQEVYNSKNKTDLSQLLSGVYILKSPIGTAKVIKQ